MLCFEERRKPEYPGKNHSEQSREPTNSTHIWHRVWESIPSHIGGRQVLSPLCQPCSTYLIIVWYKKLEEEWWVLLHTAFNVLFIPRCLITRDRNGLHTWSFKVLVLDSLNKETVVFNSKWPWISIEFCIIPHPTQKKKNVDAMLNLVSCFTICKQQETSVWCSCLNSGLL